MRRSRSRAHPLRRQRVVERDLRRDAEAALHLLDLQRQLDHLAALLVHGVEPQPDAVALPADLDAQDALQLERAAPRAQLGQLEVGLLDPRAPALELDRGPDHLPPALHELGRPEAGDLLARRRAHALHELGGAQQLDHALGERGLVALGDHEAVGAVGDLLARPVADVVADHGTALAHGLERRQRVALVVARHQERARAPQRLAGVRVVAAQGDRAGQPGPLDRGLQLVALAALAVDVEPGLRDGLDDAPEGGDRVHQALLGLEPRHRHDQVRVALRERVGQRRHVDRVGDDEHVGRAPAARRDVVALALGEVDERVHAVDPLQHAPVDLAHPRVPAPRRLQVHVVHLVEQVDAARAQRDDVRDQEARVEEHEGPLARQLADELPEPLAERPGLADRRAVGADRLDRRARARLLGDAELRDPQVGRPVGAQVVVDEPAVREPVGDPPRRPVGRSSSATRRPLRSSSSPPGSSSPQPCSR